jgi:hypothetical protein
MHLAHNTTALHHNKTPHITQEAMECRKHGVYIENRNEI